MRAGCRFRSHASSGTAARSRAAKAAIARPNVKGVSRHLSSELFLAGSWKS
ncbi:hypothetical protein ACFPM0_33025 [Pseudonocardia sulfidoxydans]|uniref:hypothetical protein n=1 Tax=Pseudonocardia sulfidoxydans TaxID=54011 RepID=UPI003613EFF7